MGRPSGKAATPSPALPSAVAEADAAIKLGHTCAAVIKEEYGKGHRQVKPQWLPAPAIEMHAACLMFVPCPCCLFRAAAKKSLGKLAAQHPHSAVPHRFLVHRQHAIDGGHMR